MTSEVVSLSKFVMQGGSKTALYTPSTPLLDPGRLRMTVKHMLIAEVSDVWGILKYVARSTKIH
jgi:hypothetical protein